MTLSILLFKFYNLQKIKLVNQVQVMTPRDELRINKDIIVYLKLIDKQANKQTNKTTESLQAEQSQLS